MIYRTQSWMEVTRGVERHSIGRGSEGLDRWDRLVGREVYRLLSHEVGLCVLEVGRLIFR